MVIIVAAIAGITRLAVQQRREQKKHLLDDFRASLERLTRQPLPAEGSTPPVSARKGLRSRKRRYESPRGEWDRVALDLEPKFFYGDRGSSEEKEGIVFAPEVQGHDMGVELEESREEPVRRPRARKPRSERGPRKPLLAGRLWRAPREPWLWTYSKPRRRPAQRSRRVASDLEYADFSTPEDVRYATEGNLSYSTRPTTRSPHSTPPFVGPHDSVRRETGEVATRRQEPRSRTGSRAT